MSILGTFVDQDFGLFDDALKPITDGGYDIEQVDEASSDGFWSFLDNLTTPVVNGLGIATQGWINSELNSHGYYDPQVVSSTGDPNDQAGNINSGEDSFVSKYQTPLMIGGGLLAVVALVLLVRK